MHTQQLITELLDELDWSYEVDRFDGEVLTGYGLEIDGQRYPVMLSLSPEASRIQLRSHLIAGTGGPDGRFDPTLAAFVAVLAYDHDLQLGVDLRDGEVEARFSLELAGVERAIQAQLLKQALKRFLVRLSQVTRFLLHFRQEVLDVDTLAGLEFLLTRPVDLRA